MATLKSTKLPCPDESAEQRQFVNMVKSLRPDVRFYAVPNGGLRNKVTARLMKLLGVSSGVPDLVFAEARGGYHGLYIEMKKAHGGQLSKTQKEWLRDLNERGYLGVACEGAAAAWDVLERYLKGEPW